MKGKILVAILIIVVVILGTLLGMKIFIKEDVKEEKGAGLGEEDDLLTVVIDGKKTTVPKTKYAGNKRTIAVVIDNVGDAIPQTSLNEAMIVYEATVEGKLTRFLAVYKDPKIETIGPARSARPYFIDYALENDSIFVHYGGSPKALSEVKTLKINNVNGIESPGNVFWRTNKKKAPHNAMVNVEEVWKYSVSKGYRTTTTERNVLNYSETEVELQGGSVANTVSVPYPESKVRFVYDEESKLYKRYIGNNLQKDFITGEALTTKNIIITFAKNYTTDEENGYGRQAIENIGSLNGYYISNGVAVKIKCKKTSRAGKTVYQDLNGNEIKVNDGNTYIQIVPIDLNIEIL